MASPRLVLVRHGATEWSVSGQHTGVTDIPLTDEGRRAAEALGDRLAGREYAIVLVSPLSRARDTAELAGFGHRAQVEADLRELDYGGVADAGAVRAQIAALASHWERHGFGYWMWFDRETGEPVGRGGLSRTHVGGRDEVEVGWAVRPERWGEGHATEMGAAAVAFAFDRLGLDDVVAYTLPDNRSSRRGVEKPGLPEQRDGVPPELPPV